MPTTFTGVKVAVSMFAQASGGSTVSPLASTVNLSGSTTPPIGGSAGQINKIYSNDIQIVNNATPFTVDLSAAADPLGAAQNFAAVQSIGLIGIDTNAANLTLGGGTNGLFAALPFVVEAQGGKFFLDNPNTGITVDGTHKIVQVVTSTGSNVKASLVVMGR